MIQICRLCLKSVHPTNNTFISVHQTDNNGVPIATLIKTLVPELYLGLSVNPVICLLCYDALRDAYSFRLQCLRSENLIGIFMRETHTTSVTIVLQDVVDYWMKVYQEKQRQTDVARANLSEWFGLEEQFKKLENKSELINVKEAESVTAKETEPTSAKETEPVAAKEIELVVAKETEPTSTKPNEPPPIKNLIMYDNLLQDLLKGKAKIDKLCKGNTATVSEKSKGSESVLKTRISGKKCENEYDPATDAEVERIVKTVLDAHVTDREHGTRYKPKAKNPTLLRNHKESAVAHEKPHTPMYKLEKMTEDLKTTNEKDSCPNNLNIEQQTSVHKTNKTNEDFQTPIEKDTPYSPPTVYCPTSVDFERNVPIGMRATALQQHNECVAVCQNPQGEKEPKLSYQHAYSRLRPPMAKTYTRTKCGLLGTAENHEAVADSGVSDVAGRVHLVYDDDEIDVKSLLSELQKNKSLEKLGLPKCESDLEKSFTVTKFIDQTDNSLSYALIPKTVTEDLSVGVQITDDELSQAILVVKKGQEHGSATEINDTTGKLLDDEISQTSEKSNSSVTSYPASEQDEESLGAVTLKPKPVTPQAKRMPMIRVRPVSSLQKIRTLNHELFPRQAKAATRLAPPGKIVMPSLRSLPTTNSSLPPVVLNSTIVSGLGKTLFGPIVFPDSSSQPSQLSPLGTATITSLGKLDSNPPANPTKLVPVTAEHMKKLGINPLNFKKLRMVRPMRKLLPYIPQSKPVAVELARDDNEVAFGISDASNRVEINRNGNKPNNDEEVIDIKEEPLDYRDSDSLNELDTLDTFSNQSGGETTRSASETSLMDQLIGDNLSHLIDSIPDVDQQVYDEPEYVHINNVSFADLTKLVKETKNVNPEQILAATPISSASQTKQFSSTFARGRKRQIRIKPVDEDGPDADYSPRPRPRRPRARNKAGVGKRWRLVQVDEYGNDIPKKRKRQPVINYQQNEVPIVERQSKDVCVLFTNFTSEGDYINDHDYLINPYLRNNMLTYKRGIESCLCLLCDILHPASTHSDHMKCHGTRCVICQVDFHNVFILNLHVRKHTSYCRECKVNVTYSRYRHHAECHNRSLHLSNIDLLPEDRVKKKRGVTLKDELAVSADCTTSVDPGAEQRRSLRLTRSRKSENIDLDEEEACIYDKVSKRFITPTRDKQQKLLAKCSAKVKKTENEEKCDKTADDQSDFITLTDLLNSSERPNINVTASADKVDLISDSQMGTIVNRKATCRPRPKRRRIFSTKRRRRMIGKRTLQTAECDDGAQQQDGSENDVNMECEENVTTEPKREIDLAVASIENATTAESRNSNAPESSENKLKSEERPSALKLASSKKSARRNPDFVISEFGKLLPQREKRTLRTHLTLNPAIRRQKLKRRATRSHQNDFCDLPSASQSGTEEILSDQTQKKKKKNSTVYENPANAEDTCTGLSETNTIRSDAVSKVVINPLSAARSSRSRGSCNLIEGLNIDGPVRGKKPRKSAAPHLDDDFLKDKPSHIDMTSINQFQADNGQSERPLEADEVKFDNADRISVDNQSIGLSSSDHPELMEAEEKEIDETVQKPTSDIDKKLFETSLNNDLKSSDNYHAKSSQLEKTLQAEEVKIDEPDRQKPMAIVITSADNTESSSPHLAKQLEVEATPTKSGNNATKEIMDIDLTNE